MIDLAIITSIPHLAGLASRGSIDMALTHLALANPAYAAYFQSRAASGVQVILDNSAYELEEATGQGLGPEPVLQAANLTGATTVICQDVLFDGPATGQATKEFLARASDLVAPGQYRFMAVPQGSTRREWLASYAQLVELDGVDVIGLSKLSVPRAFNTPIAEARLECLAAITSLGPCLPIHLLGGDRSLPWELAQHHDRGYASPTGPVVSNDSSFAYWYPACDIPLDLHTLRALDEPDTKPNLDEHTLTPERLDAAHAFVDQLRAAAHLPPIRRT